MQNMSSQVPSVQNFRKVWLCRQQAIDMLGMSSGGGVNLLLDKYNVQTFPVVGSSVKFYLRADIELLVSKRKVEKRMKLFDGIDALQSKIFLAMEDLDIRLGYLRQVLIDDIDKDL